MKNTFITTGLLALSFISTNAQNNSAPVYLDDKIKGRGRIKAYDS